MFLDRMTLLPHGARGGATGRGYTERQQHVYSSTSAGGERNHIALVYLGSFVARDTLGLFLLGLSTWPLSAGEGVGHRFVRKTGARTTAYCSACSERPVDSPRKKNRDVRSYIHTKVEGYSLPELP